MRIVDIVEAVLIGVGATLLIDGWALFLRRVAQRRSSVSLIALPPTPILFGVGGRAAY